VSNWWRIRPTHTTENISCDSLVDLVLSPMEATTNSDGNRPPASEDAEASTDDGNWTPLTTNVRRSMEGYVTDAPVTRPSGPPAMRRSDGAPAGRLDRPSLRSLLDGVPTSSLRSQAATSSIGDGLPASLGYREPSVPTFANGVGYYPPTINIF